MPITPEERKRRNDERLARIREEKKLPKEPVFRPYLTPAEFATMLGVVPSTVYRMLWHKELPHLRIGRAYRIHISTVAQFQIAQEAMYGDHRRKAAETDETETGEAE